LFLLNLIYTLISGKGNVKYDIPTGPIFEPTYVYKMLQVIKYDGFKVCKHLNEQGVYTHTIFSWLNKAFIRMQHENIQKLIILLLCSQLFEVYGSSQEVI